jgi:hypothetical protein
MKGLESKKKTTPESANAQWELYKEKFIKKPRTQTHD